MLKYRRLAAALILCMLSLASLTGATSVTAPVGCAVTNCIGYNVVAPFGLDDVSITIASPAVVSPANGTWVINPVANQAIVFGTTSALPTGITAGTVYYILGDSALQGGPSGQFHFSTSVGGAAVNTSGSQSGVQTVIGEDTAMLQTAYNTSNVTTVYETAGNYETCGPLNVPPRGRVIAEQGDAQLYYTGFVTTATISQASPAVVSWTNHGLAAGDQVYFALGGAGSLPSPLAQFQIYYVVNDSSLTANAFHIAATLNGPAINTTTAGSGTITSYRAEVAQLVKHWCRWGTQRLTASVTISNASPAVVTWTAHGLTAGQPVYFTGTLGTGLVANTVYYVVADSGLTANAFHVAPCPFLSASCAAINTTGASSGVTGFVSAFIQHRDYTYMRGIGVQGLKWTTGTSQGISCFDVSNTFGVMLDDDYGQECQKGIFAQSNGAYINPDHNGANGLISLHVRGGHYEFNQDNGLYGNSVGGGFMSDEIIERVFSFQYNGPNSGQFSGTQGGIHLDSLSNGQIINNRIEDNNGYGLDIGSGGPAAIIANNIFDRNFDRAMKLYGGWSSGVIANNTSNEPFNGRSSGTVTFAGGGTATINYTTLNLWTNEKVYFTNSGGALPAAITANTVYYVLSGFTSTTLTIAATPGGAAINMATAGTGTTTMFAATCHIDLSGAFTDTKFSSNVYPVANNQSADNTYTQYVYCNSGATLVIGSSSEFIESPLPGLSGIFDASATADAIIPWLLAQATGFTVGGADLSNGWTATNILTTGSNGLHTATDPLQFPSSAYTLTENSATSVVHQIAAAPTTATVPNETLTFSVKAKLNSGTRGLQLAVTDSGSNEFGAVFSSAVGFTVFQNTVAGTGANLATPSAVPMGGGWYCLSVTGKLGVSTATPDIVLALWNGTTPTYNGDGASGYVIYDPRLQPGLGASREQPCPMPPTAIDPSTHISTATFTLTASTTLTTVVGLDQAFTAAGLYSCDGHVHFTTAPTTSNGLKVALVGDGVVAINTLDFTVIGFNAAAFMTSGTGTATALGSTAISSLNAVTDLIVQGEINVSTGGVIHFQMGENTASGTIASTAGNARWDCHRAS